jgi:hypothetical protein
MNNTGWLYGWFDIAKYIGASIRSAQRYKQHHDMPVRELPSKKKTAIPSELDAWLIKFNQKLKKAH